MLPRQLLWTRWRCGCNDWSRSLRGWPTCRCRMSRKRSSMWPACWSESWSAVPDETFWSRQRRVSTQECTHVGNFGGWPWLIVRAAALGVPGVAGSDDCAGFRLDGGLGYPGAVQDIRSCVGLMELPVGAHCSVPPLRLCFHRTATFSGAFFVCLPLVAYRTQYRAQAARSAGVATVIGFGRCPCCLSSPSLSRDEVTSCVSRDCRDGVTVASCAHSRDEAA